MVCVATRLPLISSSFALLVVTLSLFDDEELPCAATTSSSGLDCAVANSTLSDR
jgi:hypothetical protein